MVEDEELAPTCDVADDALAYEFAEVMAAMSPHLGIRVHGEPVAADDRAVLSWPVMVLPLIRQELGRYRLTKRLVDMVRLASSARRCRACAALGRRSQFPRGFAHRRFLDGLALVDAATRHDRLNSG